MCETSRTRTSSRSRSRKREVIVSSSLRVRSSGKTSVSHNYAAIRSIHSLGGTLVSAAHRLMPSIPAGNASYDPSKAQHLLRYNNQKGVAVLGMKYREVDELTKDTLDDFKTRGWL